MKIEVCQHCDNCGDGDICSRYTRHVSKVRACGVWGRKSFNKPFSGKGMAHVIEYRKGHIDPLHIQKERK